MSKIAHKNIKKGDVWIVDNPTAVGHVQNGKRPHVVVTQVIGETVTVAPCTSKSKTHRKYTVELLPTKENGLDAVSFVLLAQSFAADISLLQKKIGHLNKNEITSIQLEYVRYVTD